MTDVKESKMDKELKALLLKNQQLKAELAKLRQLEAEADQKAGTQQATQQAVDMKAIKAAFDAIDTDHSSFVDRDEFAALCADLGEVLDDEELEAAIKQIDTSGDGKISFNEFVRWWEESTKQPKKEKKKSKLFILKAKLKAKYLSQQTSMLLKALSKAQAGASSAPTTDEKDLLQHHWHISVGDLPTPGASAALSVRFTPMEEKLPEVAHSVLVLKCTVKDEAECKTLKSLADIALADKAEGLYDIAYDSKVMTIKVFVPEADPFPDIRELKLDLNYFIPELSVKLELATPLRDVLNDPRSDTPTSTVTNVWDLAKLNFEVNAKLRKSFLPALIQAMPEQKKTAFLNFLEETKMDVHFGDIKSIVDPVIAASKSAGGVTQMIPASVTADPRSPAASIVPVVASVVDGFAEGGNEMLLEMLQRLPRKAAKPLLKNKSTVKIVEAIASGLSELTEMSVHTESGVLFKFAFTGLFPFDRLPIKL